MNKHAFSLSLSLVTEIGLSYTEKRTLTAVGNVVTCMPMVIYGEFKYPASGSSFLA